MPYFGGASGKIHILKVYFDFPCINTQRRATETFDNTPVISPPYSKHLRTGLYQGSADRYERDHESDLNCLASAILGNTLLLKTSVSDCPGSERDVFIIAIVDLISRSALVLFSLLCVSYYYNLTELVCCVHSVENI